VNAFIRLIVLPAALLSANVMASDGLTLEQLTSAKAVVAEYKELRKTCAGTVGEERKECFKVLNDANASYQNAKKELASLRIHDDTNVHLVSQAY